MFQAPITPEIQTEVQNPIDEFNREYFGDDIFKTCSIVGYSVHFRNSSLYLDFDEQGSPFLHLQIDLERQNGQLGFRHL